MAAAHELLESTTIVAIATPPGRGGIGVVRLSGAQAGSIAQQVFPDLDASRVRTAQYRVLRDREGLRIDDALVTVFSAPHSYTGEDVVEIATHGSPVVLNWVVRRAVEIGATPARPGEYTERAFLRGRLDLTAAEAVRDLIDAQTPAQARLASEQMGGSIAAQIRPAKQRLVELIATLEAGIDFAEDDIDVMPSHAIDARIAEVLPALEELLSSFEHGRLVREGVRLALIGEPNAGKSSLFNRLVQRERAIVTATPGTTRDVIAESIVLDGVPVELLDTAGLRSTEDEAEGMGVARSREAMAEADVVLLVMDVMQALSVEIAADLQALPEGRTVIVAVNKIDLLVDCAVAESMATSSGSEEVRSSPAVVLGLVPHTAALKEEWPRLPVSAKTGEGIDGLRSSILAATRTTAHTAGAATLTNLRQREAVARCVAALDRARAATRAGMPHEMVLLDLYDALRALDELTGETTPDDVLNLIFSTFCIGK